MADKLWGNILGGVAKVVAFPIAIGKGVLSAVNGDDFSDGFDKVYEDETIKEVEDFGDENSDDINTGLSAAASVVGLIVGVKVLNKK